MGVCNYVADVSCFRINQKANENRHYRLLWRLSPLPWGLQIVVNGQE